MARPRLRIVGSRGRWTAEAGPETLPVLHATWWSPRTGDYCDPMAGVNLQGARYVDYAARLRQTDRAIIQRDADPDSLTRDGYLGVFRFVDLEIAAAGAISLKIVERIADAKP